VDRIKVPEEWVFSAQALRARSDGDHDGELQYLIAARDVQAAHAVFMEHVVWKGVFQNQNNELHSLVELIQAGAAKHAEHAEGGGAAAAWWVATNTPSWAWWHQGEKMTAGLAAASGAMDGSVDMDTVVSCPQGGLGQQDRVQQRWSTQGGLVLDYGDFIQKIPELLGRMYASRGDEAGGEGGDGGGGAHSGGMLIEEMEELDEAKQWLESMCARMGQWRPMEAGLGWGSAAKRVSKQKNMGWEGGWKKCWVCSESRI
jgi:hypothetical protein